jgi:hypothetical protein
MLEINELGVVKKRKLDIIPSHFSKFKIKYYSLDNTDDSIDDWIRVRLRNRYALLNIPAIDSNGRLSVALVVAFEDHKEMTYFMLACPHFRR